MNLAFEYIKYRWNAKGRHGTHSPFVYDFVDQCMQIPLDENFIKGREELFKSLKTDHRTITIEDFGVGSKKLSNQRRISQIFRTSSSKGKYGDLLYQLSAFYKPKQILEFGTSLGIGTIHFSNGNSESNIITVEACQATRNEALENFKKLNCTNIESVHSTFNSFLNSYSGEKFDIVFIDGHHDGDALKNYLEQLNPFTHNDTLFILDDIRWSNSMFEAWTELCASQDYHVTMDLFRMGIILKRTQQVKEHFVVSI
ncbi:MAG: hypothetical protein RI883_1406 [Bacteroidota bacterium]